MLQREQWHTYGKEDGLAGDIVYEILEDRSGYLWFVTEDGGVSRLDPSLEFMPSALRTFTKEDGLADDHVEAVIEDKEGRLWFATYAGVSVYDGELISIMHDRDGNLWLGTNGGISRYAASAFSPPSVVGLSKQEVPANLTDSTK